MENTNKRTIFLTVTGAIILLSVITGALSGIIASVVTNRSIDNYIQSLSDSRGFIDISEVKPRPLPGTYEEALVQVQETGWPALAQFTVKTSSSVKVNAWIGVNDVEGVGAVVTNDGWILTEKSQLDFIKGFENNAEIWIDGNNFAVQEIVEDSMSGFVMIKVDAQNLPSLAFGVAADVLGGEILFVIPGADQLMATSLKNANSFNGEFVAPAAVFTSDWQLKDQTPHGPILNSFADLVGFSFSGGVVPLHQVLSFVQSAIKSGQAEHAAIGAEVVDLARVYNIAEELSQGIKAGALVIKLTAGPAQTAGLLENDIIISVDSVQVSEMTSLAKLITSYGVGDSAIFKVLRVDQELDFVITFENFEDLVY